MVSLSHIAGDGHTYYTLLNQLMSEDENSVQSLDPKRRHEYSKSLEDNMGKEEVGVEEHAGNVLRCLLGYLCGPILSWIFRDPSRLVVIALDTEKIKVGPSSHQYEWIRPV